MKSCSDKLLISYILPGSGFKPTITGVRVPTPKLLAIPPVRIKRKHKVKIALALPAPQCEPECPHNELSIFSQSVAARS